MYQPDLYVYKLVPGHRPLLPEEVGKEIRAVGWLDEKHPFPKGQVPEEALDRLFDLCFHPVYVTRGYHVCQFCPERHLGMKATRGGRERFLGTAEVRVFAPNDIVYAAPNLVYHYITEHQYLPPREFIDALFLPETQANRTVSRSRAASWVKGLWEKLSS